MNENPLPSTKDSISSELIFVERPVSGEMDTLPNQDSGSSHFFQLI